MTDADVDIESFGFIIVRHMTNDIDKQYWRECVECIRKFYPTEKIIIVDDNSSLQTDLNAEMSAYTNLTIIKSEYPGAGEMLGYYYGWANKPFKTFAVLHDSMFLQSKLPVLLASEPDTQQVIFLWHFCSVYYTNFSYYDSIATLPSLLA